MTTATVRIFVGVSLPHLPHPSPILIMDAAALPPVSSLPGGSDTSCTFVLNNEDHTLGNAVRFVCMRDNRTSFCGYSMPHPSEPIVNLRLQTTGGATATEVFKDSLATLAGMCDHMLELLEESAQQEEDGEGGAEEEVEAEAEAEEVQQKEAEGGGGKAASKKGSKAAPAMEEEIEGEEEEEGATKGRKTGGRKKTK